MKTKSYLIVIAIWGPIVIIYANMGGKASYEGGAIFVGMMVVGAMFTQKLAYKWLTTPKTPGNMDHSKPGCRKCGHMSFAYDDYHEDFICNECGWASKRKPTGNVNIKEINQTPAKQTENIESANSFKKQVNPMIVELRPSTEREMEDKIARKEVFLPVCLLCGEKLEEIEDWGGGLQGGDIICGNCEEKYHYSISKGKMTLRRAVVPVGFEGELERSIMHTNSTPEEEDNMMNDHDMLSVLNKLCIAYTQNDPNYKELEPLATTIGEQLNERGGLDEMRRMFAQLQNMRGARTLEMHWGGIGEWRG